MSAPPPWSRPVRLSEAQRGATIALDASEPERAAVAGLLDLIALPRLTGEVTLKPWLDGAEIEGRFEAAFTRACGVTLEPFDQTQRGVFHVRVVPAGSPNAPDPEEEIDVEADDPPDVLEGDTIDVAAYLVEHFALELDPFPRAPGAEFVQPPEPAEPSPFAKLAALKRD